MACEPIALTMLHIAAPLRLPSSMAASVSAVSPDCEMASTTLCFVEDRIAVTELGCDHHFDRDARDFFDQRFADHARICRGAAGRDVNLFDLIRKFFGEL